MIHPNNHIFHHTPESLAEWCTTNGWPTFRAKQILEWVYAKRVTDPTHMTNLSERDRQTLAADMTFLSADVKAHQLATDGTQKLLLQWWQGDTPDTPDAPKDALAGTLATSLPVLNSANTTIDYSGGGGGDPSRQTECVMIPARRTPDQHNNHHNNDASAADETGRGGRKTACISSQVGCPVGCRFCASGLNGLDGNLSAGRIVEQVYRLNLLPEVERISNIVFMGMGEPLANLRNTVHAVRTIAAPWGLAISARKITVSTVGLPQAITKLADELDLPVTLALSLHAPNDTLRRELIPWADYTTIDDLFQACDAWFKKTGREITLEYILLGGVNDQPEHARQLASVARRLRANINLIRYNEVAGLPWRRPRSEDVHTFQSILKDASLNTHIRASRGRDIAAACGQLRHEAANA